mgnify:CR=1 FL=1|nr:MAG TPA: NifZ domain [Caudoviricetes sp.]
MTNEELYKDEAEKIAKKDKTNHPAIYNGKPVPCIGFDCYKCDLHKPNSDAGCSAYYRDWLKSEAEPDKTAPEEKEKMEKDEIKVGDTVKVTTKNRMREGATGTVRTINRAKNGTKFYHVHFDGESSLYAFYEHEIEKVKSKKTPPRIVIYQNGDTVTVKDLETGETASAVCSKDDTFDLHTGAFIAMSRLTHFDTDIRLMRLEMEQIESYISDIKMRFGALMGNGYKYPDFDEEEEA